MALRPVDPLSANEKREASEAALTFSASVKAAVASESSPANRTAMSNPRLAAPASIGNATSALVDPSGAGRSSSARARVRSPHVRVASASCES